MPSNYDALPPIAQDPAHDAVVTTLNRLSQTQREGFLARVTGSHTAALFLREVLYWLSPSKKAPARPRSTIYRPKKPEEGVQTPESVGSHYWMVRTQEEWMELNITRNNLETIYRRCDGLIERDYRMYAAQRRAHYRIKFERLRELMDGDETLQACLASDLAAAKSRTPVVGGCQLPVVGGARGPSVHSLDQSVESLAITSACSPSAQSGAAAPEPPQPARTSVPDSVESAPVKPEVTSFRQAQAILRSAEGAPTTEKLKRLAPYGARTRLAVGYLLIWQGECERNKQDYRLCEAHFLQAGELAEDQEVPLGEFAGILKAAWKTTPQDGFDPCFMSSHHSRKFTLFCKHFRRMQDELLEALNEK